MWMFTVDVYGKRVSWLVCASGTHPPRSIPFPLFSCMSSSCLPLRGVFGRNWAEAIIVLLVIFGALEFRSSPRGKARSWHLRRVG